MLDVPGMPAYAIAAIGAGGAGLATFAAVVGIRKLIRMGQFAYHNSRLSTMGNPYVMRDEVVPLTETASPELLAKTVNSDLDPGSSPGSFREVDRSLMKSFHEISGSLLIDSPVPARSFVRAYISRLEAEELKRLLRVIGKRRDPLLPVGRVNDDVERQMLSSGDIPAALEVLEGLPAARRMLEIARNGEDINLSSVDDALDRFVLDELRSVDGGMVSRRGSRAFHDLMADRFNVHFILRSKRMEMEREDVLGGLYLDGGTLGRPTLEQMADSSGSREAITVLGGTYMEPFLKEIDPEDMSSLENALNRILLEGVRGLSHSYGSSIGPTIRYLYSKEMELHNLRVLFQASFSGWDPEKTRKHLVIEEGY